MRLVAKFGGTSLGTGDRIERAADSVAAVVEAGHEVVVVASAMGSTTDDLLEEIDFEADEADVAEIVSMGERTSVRMLKAALSARGVAARFIEPGSPDWPIVVDAAGEVDPEATTERADAVAATLGDSVPVVTGFLAEGPDGAVTTLGRGGSDTTAVMLGRYLDADQVVIVTDVEGVMTGDPRAVEGARNVGEITVDELRSLSFRGAEVVAPSALAYKTGDLEVRVLHYQNPDLLTGGTDIVGQFENLIDMREDPLSCLTVAGRAVRNQPGILSKLSTALGESSINIDAVSSGLDSITLYVDADEATEAEDVLHREVIEDQTLSSVTVEEPIAVIRVTGGDLTDQSGVLIDMLSAVSESGIGVHDVITSATSAALFVDWPVREEAFAGIQSAFD
ncbi:MAG: aspartate kinase [Halobacteriales archaeon]|nr:aspartate kinase [Halobacteriales archaeon]